MKKEFRFPENIIAPDVEKRAKTFSLHGDNRLDNYDWINGFFYKNADSTKIVDYLTAENNYADTMLA